MASKSARTVKKKKKPVPDSRFARQKSCGVIVGIDPGQTGALAAIDGLTGELLEVLDMPVVFANNSKAKLIDGIAVRSFLDRYSPSLIVVEMVSAMPKQGVSTTFQFGMSYGAAVSLALSYPCQVRLVTAAAWKAQMRLPASKQKTLSWARNRWPDHALLFRRVTRDTGRADACAIADWGRLYHCNISG